MDFAVSSKYINKRCGLHLKEYQQENPDNVSQMGIINGLGKFIKCSCHEHITREEYNEVLPKIIDEFINAGCFRKLKFFEKGNNINDIFSKLKLDNTPCSDITSQKNNKYK